MESFENMSFTLIIYYQTLYSYICLISFSLFNENIRACTTRITFVDWFIILHLYLLFDRAKYHVFSTVKYPAYCFIMCQCDDKCMYKSVINVKILAFWFILKSMFMTIKQLTTFRIPWTKFKFEIIYVHVLLIIVMVMVTYLFLLIKNILLNNNMIALKMWTF